MLVAFSYSVIGFSADLQREKELNIVSQYEPKELETYGFTLPVASKVSEVHQLAFDLQADFYFYRDKVKYVETANKIIKLDPNYPSAYLMKSFYVQDPEEYKQQVTYAYELSKKSFLKSERLMLRAEYALLVEEDYKKAQQYFKDVVDMYPDSAAAVWSLGMAYYYGGKLDKAYESYKKSTEIIPNLPKGYEFMSVILYTKKDFKQALEYLKKAQLYGANPKNDLYYSEYENLVYYKNGLYQETVDSINEAFTYGELYRNSERLNELYKLSREKLK